MKRSVSLTRGCSFHQNLASGLDEALILLCAGTARLGGNARRRATQEDKTAQCRAYGQYKNWALKACDLAEEEVKEHLTKAAGLHPDKFGRGDLPAAFRRNPHHKDTGKRLKAREHAELLCRVAGLRKAASGGEVGGLGGREEMDRLLALGGNQLQEAARAIPAHLREAGSFALQGACVRDADARVAAVVGLFQAWVFNAGARRLGAEAAWQELLRPQQPRDADDSVFSASESLGALAESRGESPVIDAWCRLRWSQKRRPPAMGVRRAIREAQRARQPSGKRSAPASQGSAASAALAPSSSGSGPAASSSSATRQAARTQRRSASAHAAPLPVVAIGNAIVQCAKAVRDAGLLGVDETGDTGELPTWDEVPTDCGFKRSQLGGKIRRRATGEDKAAQCRAYAQFKHWALKACGLAEQEVKEHLTQAAGLRPDMLGRGDLPAAFRRRNHDGPNRLSAREHAALLCRVAGLRKAASGDEVGGLGGREEMERLLALGDKQLQEQGRAIPAHLRKAGSFALEGLYASHADDRVAAVVGLFQAWVFNAGARRLGAEAAWQELLRPQHPLDANGKPAHTFPLGDSVFSATGALGALAERRSPGVNIDTGKLITQGKSRVIGAWWRLVWRQACAEVRGRFGPERRCVWISGAPPSATGQSCSATGQGAAAVKEEIRALAPPQVEGAKEDEKCAQPFEFCMEELYRMLFQAEESPERERKLNALYKECDQYVRHFHPTSLSKECGRLNMQHACTNVGSFDVRTRQVLWKYAATAWLDGWPTGRASAGNAEYEDEGEEEAPMITPLPKEAVKGLGDGRYKFRSYTVQAASREEAWPLLDAAYREEQEQTAKVQRMAAKHREKHLSARSILCDALHRPGALHELRPPRAAYGGVFLGRFGEDEHRVTFIEEHTGIRVCKCELQRWDFVKRSVSLRRGCSFHQNLASRLDEALIFAPGLSGALKNVVLSTFSEPLGGPT